MPGESRFPRGERERGLDGLSNEEEKEPNSAQDERSDVDFFKAKRGRGDIEEQ